jgi:urease accessory protein
MGGVEQRLSSMGAGPEAAIVSTPSGSVLGMEHLILSFVKLGTVASIVAFNFLVAAAVARPISPSAMTMAVFAVLHGYAHGSETLKAANGMG